MPVQCPLNIYSHPPNDAHANANDVTAPETRFERDCLMLAGRTCQFSSPARAVQQQRPAPQAVLTSPVVLQQRSRRCSQLTVRAAAVAERSDTMTSSKAMDSVFPEALSVLEDVDPEVASIIEDEKARQW
jgi:hypothetical protein